LLSTKIPAGCTVRFEFDPQFPEFFGHEMNDTVFIWRVPVIPKKLMVFANTERVRKRCDLEKRISALMGALFTVLGFMALTFFLQIAFPIVRAGRPVVDVLDVVLMFLWLMAGLICLGVVIVLRDVKQYPESIDNIEKRITKLKNKLLGRGRVE
jgi:hypothetical protein